MASVTSSSSSSSKLCYNPQYKQFKSQFPKKGWKLRSGDSARLCNRCGSAFEEGRFCETFHLNASGWSNCEICRKRIHCGCIVSANSFRLLDPGGIECIGCAREHLPLSSIQPLPQSFSFQNHLLFERLRDLSAKGWNQLAGSGPVQPWKQVPSPFNSISSPNLHPDVSFIVDLSHNVDKIYGNKRLPVTSMEKKIEDLSGIPSWSAKLGSREMMLMNGVRSEDKSSSCLNICQQSPSLKEDSALRPFGLSVPYASPNERNGQIGITESHPQQTPPPPPPGKQFSGTVHLSLDSSGETQAHNGRPHVDALGRNQLLPRYWPRCTELELQKLSVDSNSIITPLFQKTLSASDAGRIGRLVLPKKFAEVELAKEALGSKSSISRKRKSSILGSKSKRLLELKITWQEARGLLHPPPSHVPSIVLIGGFEFEEYEDAPVLGKPTIFTTGNDGEKIQWAQCEYCLKWRKLPASALLPSKWTCSDNSWDLERSYCSAAQELTAEELENLLLLL